MKYNWNSMNNNEVQVEEATRCAVGYRPFGAGRTPLATPTLP